MKVSCYCRAFSHKWDDKLNLLIEEGSVVDSSHTDITFELIVDSKVVPHWVFWTKTVTLTERYCVWVANKKSHYGELQTFNGEHLPVHMQFSASQATLQKLLNLENKVRNPKTVKAYL